MNYAKLGLWAFLFIALGAIIWRSFPVAYFVVRIAMDPPECDEGQVVDRRANNARGDVVAEYVRACTGIGTFVDHSITLQLHGEEKTTTLAEHGDLRYDYPKFNWIDDNALTIDLGRIRWIRPKVAKVGPIRITYSYTYSDVE